MVGRSRTFAPFCYLPPPSPTSMTRLEDRVIVASFVSSLCLSQWPENFFAALDDHVSPLHGMRGSYCLSQYGLFIFKPKLVNAN
jgi:hypothetical protein